MSELGRKVARAVEGCVDTIQHYFNLKLKGEISPSDAQKLREEYGESGDELIKVIREVVFPGETEDRPIGSFCEEVEVEDLERDEFMLVLQELFKRTGLKITFVKLRLITRQCDSSAKSGKDNAYVHQYRLR